jgi:hypothetical protein
VVIADDRMTADDAYGLACQGIALMWRGDFQNARQMLAALANRADRPPRNAGKSKPEESSAPKLPAEAFRLDRQGRSRRARTLGMLLVPLDLDYSIPLRRAPDIREACMEAYGPQQDASVVSLREVLGVIGAHEWRHKGIDLPAVGMRIHPHYGVFAPIRNEYVDLVATAPLPAAAASVCVAFDIGTGTGVLAAVLARRGIQRVIATDQDLRALACARENLERLGLAARVEVVQADLFPEGRAALVVCNPPWVPARPSSPLEQGIYDPESRMLHGFLRRRLVDPFGSRGASRPAIEGGATRLDRRRGAEGGGSDRRAAQASAGIRHNRPASSRAQGGGDIALAALRAVTWASSNPCSQLALTR